MDPDAKSTGKGSIAPTAHLASSNQRIRLPTVNEALPYSPFSSIVPFDPTFMGAPSTLESFLPNVFSNSAEQKSAKNVLDQLNKNATGAEDASRRCQQTLREVQRLLNPDELMQFTFRPRRPAQDISGAAKVPSRHSTQLGPFSQMVLQQTNVSYRYITPESPRTSGKGDPKKEFKAQPQSSVPQHSTNGQVKPPASRVQDVQVVIDTSAIPVNRAEYEVYNEPERLHSAYNLSPSKQRNGNLTNGARPVTTDQKQRSDLAVENLRSSLELIFDAEEQLQSGHDRSQSNDPGKVIVVRETEDGTVLILQSDIQARLESHLHKVVAGNRLADFELEDLLHVQKLCEGAIVPLQSLPLSVEEDWTESDIEEWLSKLSMVETGLSAARTTMRIMAGGSRQKELQSENYLHQVLEAFKNILEFFLVPLVEMASFTGEKMKGQKEGMPANPRFTVAFANRQVLQSLSNAATKGLRIIGELLIKTDFDPVNITAVEFLCKRLLFAENATPERESILGSQNFETMRRSAMDVLARIFTKYHDQRSYIFDEILFSLEKLPATKQSARQYRLADAKPIQLVSALFMRLIQTSATTSLHRAKARSHLQESDGEGDDEDDDDEDASGSSDEEIKTRPVKRKSDGRSKDLRSLVKPFSDAAQEHASYIVRYLINRASSTTKSGDEPYRKLLDIFTEDFLNVLGSCDWPAAELLLFSLARNMVMIAENAKTPAPARTMALEFLGTMGSGILELHIATRSAAQAIDTESNVGYHLTAMVDQADSGNLDAHAVTALDGPYRIVLEHLSSKGDDSAQHASAQGYHLTEWASLVSGARAASVDSDGDGTASMQSDLQSTLMNMIQDPHWLSEHSQISPVSPPETHLAAKVLTLNAKFCRAFNRIFNTLLASMSSEQPTVRSRSIKSVEALLEKDPAVLDRNSNVLQHIFGRTSDASPLVRDSALGLIAKCISLRPSLDASVYQQVISRSLDSASGVKRRAIKILKDIYLRNDAVALRSAIASAVIAKIRDVDESVAELARSTIEEIFFQPFHAMKLDGESSVHARLAYSAHTGLLIQTLEANDEVIKIFDGLLKRLLNRSKVASQNTEVCRTLVAILFDGIIDSTDIDGTPSQDMILRTLTVFAKASPKLFTAPQLERLEPYLSNLSTSEDLEIYRSAVTILRHTITHQSLLRPESLGQLQSNLLKTVSKIPKTEMKDIAQEVAPCVWTISEMIGGNSMLSNFVRSAVLNIFKSTNDDMSANPQSAVKAVKLICIVGAFGKACDFNPLLGDWKAAGFSWYKGDSIPALMVEIICQFTSPKRPLDVRIAAIGAICSISQAWPHNFLRADVTNAFEMIFEERTPELEEALLSGLEAFFCAQERSDGDDEKPDGLELGSGIASGKARLGGTYVGTDVDSALTSMAQRFLPQIRQLALDACNEPAFISARLIITINSQGLGHPKDSAPALVALETCPNAVIAKRAFEAHKDQGLSRESVFEKEYMRGVQLAFEYQQRVAAEDIGFTGQPPVSKLRFLWDVLKAGKAGVRGKFLGNLVRKLDFELASLNRQHLMFVHFCLGNLAFFEYDKVDEVLSLVTSLEKLFSGTGTDVAQAIESEVLNLQVNGLVDSIANDPSVYGNDSIMPPSVDPRRLQQLALAGQLLCLVWETRSFIRRLYNLQKQTVKPKKSATKEVNKNAYRASHAPSLTEAYQRRAQDLMTPLDNEDKQRAMCSSFVELFTVDNEVKVGTEDDMGDDLADADGTASEAGSTKSPSSKKRKGGFANGSPRKKSRASLGKKKTSSFNRGGDDDSDEEGDVEAGDWV